jgi:benzoyl-CoA reductase/2-hydroxyglutaryl-CoA dehydratase subunit BcrC/BadD/HgdB
MSDQYKALKEMRRLTSPFPESTVVKDWKAQGKRVIGYVGPAVPEEVIHAAKMLPLRVSGDNEPVPTDTVDAYLLPQVSTFARSVLQTALDGKWDFLDGAVTSIVNEGTRRMYDNWLAYKRRPYMDSIYLPLKQTEHAVEMYLADLEDWRNRMSEFRGARILDRDLLRSIEVYNSGRELMQQFYELRKAERPPVTGAEALEVIKAATRLPREQFNELLGQLLKEIKAAGRESKKAKRLMVIGSQLENSTWIEAIEALDAVVVTDELEAGTRYFWGKVDTKLPPMEALARYYISGRPPSTRIWPAGKRFEHIFNMAKQYKVDGVISEILRNDAEYGHDKLFLDEEMKDRGIPILELDVDYGEHASAQMKTRVEAFVEMLHTGAKAPAKAASKPQLAKQR